MDGRQEAVPRGALRRRRRPRWRGGHKGRPVGHVDHPPLERPNSIDPRPGSFVQSSISLSEGAREWATRAAVQAASTIRRSNICMRSIPGRGCRDLCCVESDLSSGGEGGHKGRPYGWAHGQPPGPSAL